MHEEKEEGKYRSNESFPFPACIPKDRNKLKKKLFLKTIWFNYFYFVNQYLFRYTCL